MKYGVHLTAKDWDTFTRRAARADEGGFSHVWVAETPFFAHDPYIALVKAVEATKTCQLGPGCTNAVLRHEVLIASALSSIDALSSGRVVCGLGSGDRAVRLLKKRPTSIDEIREIVRRLRGFWNHEAVDYGGSAITAAWSDRVLPVYLFAEGFRSLALGGECADAVVVGSGINEEVVVWAQGRIDEGAAQAGREPPEVWYACFGSVADNQESARSAVRPRLANRVRHNYMAAPDLVPEEHRGECEFLVKSFDLAEWHQASQAELVTDYMVDRFALTGEADDVIAGVRLLEARGVGGLVLNFPPDSFDEHIDVFANKIIPETAR